MTRTTVAITGASGFVGTELTRYFTSKGWDVVALVRDSTKYQPTGSVSYRDYNLLQPISADTLSGVDYLVHTAYIKHGPTHPEALTENSDAATALVAAARQADVKHMVFMSSMSAHDSAESIYGKQKLAVESIFSGSDAASIRSGLIVGNGGIVKKMFSFMKSKHVVPLIGGGTQPLQIIAVYDLARIIATILEQKHSGLFTIATPAIYSYRDFYTAISRRYNIKIIFLPVPFWALLGAVRLIGLLHLPLAVNADSVVGLKYLRAANTAADLSRLNLAIDPLETALKNTTMT